MNLNHAELFECDEIRVKNLALKDFILFFFIWHTKPPNPSSQTSVFTVPGRGRGLGVRRHAGYGRYVVFGLQQLLAGIFTAQISRDVNQHGHLRPLTDAALGGSSRVHLSARPRSTR